MRRRQVTSADADMSLNTCHLITTKWPRLCDTNNTSQGPPFPYHYVLIHEHYTSPACHVIDKMLIVIGCFEIISVVLCLVKALGLDILTKKKLQICEKC